MWTSRATWPRASQWSKQDRAKLFVLQQQLPVPDGVVVSGMVVLRLRTVDLSTEWEASILFTWSDKYENRGVQRSNTLRSIGTDGMRRQLGNEFGGDGCFRRSGQRAS